MLNISAPTAVINIKSEIRDRRFKERNALGQIRAL